MTPALHTMLSSATSGSFRSQVSALMVASHAHRLLRASRLALFAFLAPLALYAAPRIENSTLVLDHAFSFEGNTATLTSASKAAVAETAEFLRAKTFITRVRIEGHVAAAKQSPASAQTLSEARARAVCAALIAQGIDCARLLPVGFGANKPAVAPGDAANTRIEIKMAALRGKLIGGLPEDGGGQVAGNPCEK